MMGRALIADPQYINKLAEDRQEDIRPCLRCNNYCICHFFKLSPVSCAVNPQAGQEDMLEIRKTARPQRVAVVGGGPGGMEAALLAAQAGHQVDLYDSAEKLGGQMNAAATPPFKGQMRKLLAYLKREVDKSGVRVHLNTKITPDSVELKNADQIVLALGATPIHPNIPGIKRENVIEIMDAHLSRKSDVKGDNIVVLGGGLSGCEYALEKAMEGKNATVVEMTGELAVRCNMENRKALHLLMKKYGVRQLVNTKCVGFNENGVVVESQDGTQQMLPADTAIVALGTKSNSAAAIAIKNRYPNAFLVGDCTGEVALVGDAMHDAYRAVWLMDGDRKEKEKYLKRRDRTSAARQKLASYLMPQPKLEV